MTNYRIENVGVQDFDVEPESVDLILTDPPYPREFIWTWTVLAEFAERTLRPGGSVLAMSGQMFLPEWMQALDARLDYQWLIACMTPGSNGRIWPRRFVARRPRLRPVPRWRHYRARCPRQRAQLHRLRRRCRRDRQDADSGRCARRLSPCPPRYCRR